MATKNARIVARKSSTALAVPLAGNTLVAELLLNLADRKFYSKDANDNIFQVAPSMVEHNLKAPISSPAFTDVPTAPTPGTSDNSTKLATTAFVKSVIAALVDSSPATLDTLNEIAEALGDDPNFAATMTTALGNRLRVDINNQGLNPTQQANARTNLALALLASSGSADDLADGTTKKVLTSAERTKIASALQPTDIGTTAGKVAAGDDSRIVGAVQTSRTLTGANGVDTIGSLASNRTVQLVASLGLTHGSATNVHLLLSSGRYFGLPGITNAPDATQAYWYDVDGNGVDYAKIIATDTSNSNRVWSKVCSGGAWTAWTLWDPKNILTWNASPLGLVSATAAITAACAFQTGRLIGTAAFSAVPQAPVIDLKIPEGNWHVANLVDTGNKNVTYYVDENATFTSGSMDNLNAAKIVRKNRVTSNFLSGILDSATLKSAMGGDGAADRSPLVNGITAINQIGMMDTFDAVADYADMTGIPLLHTSAATFTSTTCTMSSAIDVKKLRVGTTILTSNNYAGQILSWNGAGTIITVTGWYPLGSTTPGTPAAGSVYLNPISEVYVRNSNVFLTALAYTYQGTAHEMGLINNKVAPSSAEDPSGKTWMSDAVNLGGFRGSIGHITRGDWWEGFRATGVQKGFVAKAYPSLGYTTPLVGFEYEGNGNALIAKNAAGTTLLAIDSSTGKINAQKLALYAMVNAANDAAAAAAGCPVGELYRNGSVVMFRAV